MVVHEEHIYAGTLCGHLAWWSIDQLRNELSKPSEGQTNTTEMEDEDEFELEAKMQIQVLHRAALLDLSVGHINQV